MTSRVTLPSMGMTANAPRSAIKFTAKEIEMTDLVRADPLLSSVRETLVESNVNDPSAYTSRGDENSHLSPDAVDQILADECWTIIDLHRFESNPSLEDNDFDVSVSVFTEVEKPCAVPVKTSSVSMEKLGAFNTPQPETFQALIQHPDSPKPKRTRRKTMSIVARGQNPYGRVGKRRCVRCRKWRQKARDSW